MTTSTRAIVPADIAPGSSRRLGRALVWFGSIGLVLLLLTSVAFALGVAPLASTAAGLEDQRDQLVALLDPAAASLDSAATSADHGVVSLVSSEASAREGAAVTSQLASAMEGLGVFSSSFAETAARSRALSENLMATATALHQNQVDSASVATNLRSLANQLKSLRTSVTAGSGSGAASSRSSGTSAPGLGVPLLVGLAVALLLWLAALALGCIWIGRQLLRTPRSRVDNAS
jgi:cobalamin biosynthesis Mg chelatase CobN